MIKDPVLTPQDIDHLAQKMQEASLLAIAMADGIEPRFKTGPDDQVTEADIAISELLSQAIRERFTDDCVISEEDEEHRFDEKARRVWLIDPIDGTQNYILQDGQYCVMLGLLIDRQPAFGFVAEPATGTLYFGGPGQGAFREKDGIRTEIKALGAFNYDGPKRLTMGSRDRRRNPWIGDIEHVEIVKTGSIGLKIVRMLEDKADVFAHLGCKLKVWDTAGPAALALGAGLQVGTMDWDGLHFDLPKLAQQEVVIMGKPGALKWCRENLR